MSRIKKIVTAEISDFFSVLMTQFEDLILKLAQRDQIQMSESVFYRISLASFTLKNLTQLDCLPLAMKHLSQEWLLRWGKNMCGKGVKQRMCGSHFNATCSYANQNMFLK